MEDVERLLGEELKKRQSEGMSGRVKVEVDLQGGKVVGSRVSSIASPKPREDHDEKNQHFG